MYLAVILKPVLPANSMMRNEYKDRLCGTLAHLARRASPSSLNGAESWAGCRKIEMPSTSNESRLSHICCVLLRAIF